MGEDDSGGLVQCSFVGLAFAFRRPERLAERGTSRLITAEEQEEDSEACHAFTSASAADLHPLRCFGAVLRRERGQRLRNVLLDEFHLAADSTTTLLLQSIFCVDSPSSESTSSPMRIAIAAVACASLP